MVSLWLVLTKKQTHIFLCLPPSLSSSYSLHTALTYSPFYVLGWAKCPNLTGHLKQENAASCLHWSCILLDFHHVWFYTSSSLIVWVVPYCYTLCMNGFNPPKTHEFIFGLCKLRKDDKCSQIHTYIYIYLSVHNHMLFMDVQFKTPWLWGQNKQNDSSMIAPWVANFYLLWIMLDRNNGETFICYCSLLKIR